MVQGERSACAKVEVESENLALSLACLTRSSIGCVDGVAPGFCMSAWGWWVCAAAAGAVETWTGAPGMVESASRGVHRIYVGVGVTWSGAGDGGSHPDGVENGAVAAVIRLLGLGMVKGRREKYSYLGPVTRWGLVGCGILQLHLQHLSACAVARMLIAKICGAICQSGNTPLGLSQSTFTWSMHAYHLCAGLL